MIILDSTTKTLEVTTSSTSSTDYYISYADITSSTFTAGDVNGNISTATTTTVLSAPAASTQRQVKFISIVNKGSAAQSITVKIDISGTERVLTPTIILAAGESYSYSQDTGWTVVNKNGLLKTNATDTVGYNGFPQYFYKVGTAPEAAGIMYGWWKDTGSPGAWSPGTPGLSGRTTDGGTSTDAGCLYCPAPSSGSNYLVDFQTSASVACSVQLWDVLWVNSGAVVTTTTAQTVNSTTLPARDAAGSTNGEQVFAAIVVTTATTNAGAITNMTLSYTNSAGTSGRTAAIASFPATAVIGTVVPFQLAAGDTGIRSIQSITLGTSLAAGSVSLILYRPLTGLPIIVANSGTANTGQFINPGIKLYTGSCILPFQLPTATTATTVHGFTTIVER